MQTHNARRSHASKIATLVLAAAFVAAALTAMSVAPPAQNHVPMAAAAEPD